MSHEYTCHSYMWRICEFQLQFSNRLNEVAHGTSTVSWPRSGHSTTAQSLALPRLRPTVIGDMLQFKTVGIVRVYKINSFDGVLAILVQQAAMAPSPVMDNM